MDERGYYVWVCSDRYWFATEQAAIAYARRAALSSPKEAIVIRSVTTRNEVRW